MSKITKKEINAEFKALKDILEAAKVFSDISWEYSDLVKAQFCLSALAVKAQEVEQVIRQLEIQNSKAVA